jgi:hypothetical protein
MTKHLSKNILRAFHTWLYMAAICSSISSNLPLMKGSTHYRCVTFKRRTPSSRLNYAPETSSSHLAPVPIF